MQKLRTRVIKKNLNPEWNENLTLSVTDPILPVKIVWGFLHYNNLFFLSKIETEQNIHGSLSFYNLNAIFNAISITNALIL